MSIFSQNQHTAGKARFKQALLLLTIMTLLMGFWGTPQVEAQEPTGSQDSPYLVAGLEATTLVVVPLQSEVMPDWSDGEKIIASPSCEATELPELRMLSNGDFLAFWPTCYSRFERNSDGTFKEVDLGEFPTGWDVGTPAADLNNDGIDDLLLVKESIFGTSFSYTYKVALGQADGRFDLSARPLMSYGSRERGDHTLGDLNGDGNLDLVNSLTDIQRGTTWFYMRPGNGDGTFASQVTLLNTQDYVGTAKLVLDDLNGNRHTDIFLPPNDNAPDMGQAYIALNNGKDDFTIQESIDFRPDIEDSQPGTLEVSALTCDINLDRRVDLIAYSNHLATNTGDIAIHLSIGNGNFEQNGHMLHQGSNQLPSLACFSPMLIETLTLADGTEIAAGLISVVATSDAQLNGPPPGYEWNELERTLLPGDQLAILYQVEPNPLSESDYLQIITWLEENNDELSLECVASMNPVFGSPNTWDVGGAKNSTNWPNPAENTFREQWAFEQIKLPNPLGSNQGEGVVLAFLDVFQNNVKDTWGPHATYYYDVYQNVLPPLENGEYEDISEHGDMAMSLAHHMAPKSELWPIRVMNHSGRGYSFTIIEGLSHVIEQLDQHPEKQFVINMSLGLNISPESDDCAIQMINKLLQKAEAKGAIVVAAAGNEAEVGSPPPESQYPANVASVMGVEASGPTEERASYSNKGEISAPGGDISGHCSTNPTEDCFKKFGIIGHIPTSSGGKGIAWEGTSFAAPLVSGLAANLLACKPDLTPTQIRDLIYSSSSDNMIDVEQTLANENCLSSESVAPWQENANGSLGTNIRLGYAMGYHFTPQVDGEVTELGGLFNGTKTVRLFNKQTGELLAETTATAANDWGYGAIDPVTVQKDVTYTVAIYLAGTGGSRRDGINQFPQIYGDIRIEGTTFIRTNRNPNARPTNMYDRHMYGQADIKFRAN